MSKCVETRNARLKEFGSQLESAFLLTTTNIQVREMLTFSLYIFQNFSREGFVCWYALVFDNHTIIVWLIGCCWIWSIDSNINNWAAWRCQKWLRRFTFLQIKLFLTLSKTISYDNARDSWLLHFALLVDVTIGIRHWKYSIEWFLYLKVSIEIQ